jgi:hypothetical protein
MARRRHDDAPDDDELADRRRELLRAYVDSVPPPPDLIAASGRFEARFEPESSAIHDLRELQRLQRATDTNAMAVRLDEERARRITAETQLDKRTERLWLVLTGAAAIVLAALVVWIVVALLKADRSEPPPHAHPTPTQTRAARPDRAV